MQSSIRISIYYTHIIRTLTKKILIKTTSICLLPLSLPLFSFVVLSDPDGYEYEKVVSLIEVIVCIVDKVELVGRWQFLHEVLPAVHLQQRAVILLVLLAVANAALDCHLPTHQSVGVQFPEKDARGGNRDRDLLEGLALLAVVSDNDEGIHQI